MESNDVSSTPTYSSFSGSNSGISDLAKLTTYQRCRTNCALDTSAERAQISSLADKAQFDVARLDEEILRAQAVTILAHLRNERYQLQRFVECAQSLSAPIRKLPPEILCEVFAYHCLSENSMSLSICGTAHWVANNDRNQISCPTLDIAHTCAFWRSIAFSQPSLWAALEIDFEAITNGALPQLISHFLRASRLSSLLVEASMSPPGIRTLADLSSHALDVFAMLLAQSHRWQDVVCYANGQVWSSFMDAAFTQISWAPASDTPAFPVLTTLCSKNLGSLRYFDALSALNSAREPFTSCPTLRRYEIAAFQPRSMDSLCMPNLTDLHLHFYFEGFGLVYLLSLFLQLRICHIEALLPVDFTPPTTNMQRFFDLTALSLEFFAHASSECEDAFFRSLSLPRLKTLDLRWEENQTNHSELLAMLTRSRCQNLNELRMVGFSERAIVQILECSPNLPELVLCGTKDLIPTLRRLTLCEDPESDLVPHLFSLQIHESIDPWWTVPGSSLDALCGLLDSRSRALHSTGTPRLRRLALQRHCNEFGPAEVDPMTSLSLLPVYHPLHQRLQPFFDDGLRLKLIE